MEKSKLTVAVIIITLFSVGIMLYYSDTAFNFNIGSLLRPDAGKEKLIKGDIGKYSDKSKEKNKKDNAGGHRPNPVENRSSENATNTDKSDDSNVIERNNTTLQMKKSEKITSRIASINLQASDILKVPKESIEKDMSVSDKASLLSISTKISPSDYARINNYLQEEDQIGGIAKIVSLLKMRLSNKDYGKFKDVAIKYIDMDKLEKFIASSGS